jgi:hypothetical protein
MSPQDKATTERHARTLRELVKRQENKVCADCKHNGTSVFSLFAYTLTPTLDPRWASWNMCVLVHSSFAWRFMFAPVVYFCAFAALVFTVEWALTSAKSSRSILTHGHLSRWRYVFSPLLTPFSLINLQDRTYKNGAIVLPTYFGKHISNRVMFPQISEYRSLVVTDPSSDITITISVR